MVNKLLGAQRLIQRSPFQGSEKEAQKDEQILPKSVSPAPDVGYVS